MGVLTEIPDCKIYTSKCRLSVNPAFNYVLDIQKLYKEDCLTDLEKIDTALEMLVRNSWNLRLLNPKEKAEAMEEIAARFIRTKKRPEIKKNPVPVLDFEEDGDYIYASFMKDYRIDLIDEQGRLPWKKFLYLFNGLSADTKIKQVMQIRQMELPRYNGKNAKEIQEINELKSYYALPVQGGGGQSGLDLLFHTLEGMAKR
jgi:hypothetical protein|nr:MAG TPA: hypothetical protein [Caudoviricetes sp.]